MIYFYVMTICNRQFPCSLCYIELSSLYLKVAKRHENNINFNISLIKNTTTFKFAHGLPVAVFYAMEFAKKIFSKRKYFFPIYKLLTKMVYLEVCKFEKKYFRLENIFLRIPSPRKPRQVCCVQI